jgi:hypothetical protein
MGKIMAELSTSEKKEERGWVIQKKQGLVNQTQSWFEWQLPTSNNTKATSGALDVGSWDATMIVVFTKPTET